MIYGKIKQKQSYSYKTIKYSIFALLLRPYFLSSAVQGNELSQDLISKNYCNKSILKLPIDRKLYKKPNIIIGEILIHKVDKDETLYDIARDYDIGSEELIYANLEIDPWLPGEGTSVIIPSMHILPSVKCEGIVINKAELRLYYFSKACEPKYIFTFPIGLGEFEHDTPLGTTYIIKKQKDPFWIPPISIKLEKPYLPNVIPPGDKNPLGHYAIYLGWQSILIHGTDKPWSIGTYSTHGCIRMYPEDIKSLFDKVKVGTIVQVVDQPIKIGCRGEGLYIEATPTQEQKYQLDLFGKVMMNSDLDLIKTKIINQYNNIDENVLDDALQRFQGIPIKIN